MYKNKTITAIIPCYNEGPRIDSVLKPVLRSKFIDAVIAVDDCSTDNSVAKILEFDGRVKLIRQKKNQGKAAAVFAGTHSAETDLIFFIDADLHGLRATYIDNAITQFVDTDLDMLLVPVGVPSILDPIATLLGTDIIIAGSRILKREKILPFLPHRQLGFGLEMYINRVAENQKWKTDVILFKKANGRPISTPKIKKLGLIKGLKSEFRMLSEISKTGHLSDYLELYRRYVIKKPNKGLKWLRSLIDNI